jgi:dipeptidyl aminopeptidase/acylaminoacyl peptidase
MALPAVSASSARAQTAAPSLDELLAPSTLLDAALSPDGRQLAVLRVDRGADQLKAFILLQPADKPRDPPTTVVLGDYDVQRLEWASNDRLLIWVNIHKEMDGRKTGYWIGDLFFAAPLRRIISMSLDGSQSTVLFGGQKRTSRQEFDLATIVDMLPDDPNHVLMQAWDSLKSCYILYKVDLTTGVAAFYERGEQATYGWLTQNGVPVIRFDANRRGTIVSLYTRAPGEKDWRLYRKLRRDELLKFADLEVVGVTPEDGVVLIAVQDEKDEAKVIRRFDLRNWQFGDVVASRPGRDVDSVFVDERNQLVAAAFTDDRLDYVFFDTTLKAHYRGLQTFFKNDANIALYDASVDHGRLILYVSSPTQPGGLWFYDRNAGSLTALGDKRPWLNGRLASMRISRIKSRDGLELTTYLTVPSDGRSGPRPLIVFPHGGPESRDTYDYDNFLQAFAAKGWLILQVNFRGSGGYGRTFADAGRKRWGVEMQNDVEDAVAAVIASGQADPNRVAICGASYGGYAALMGAIKTPKAYKAVVSIAGVSDLSAMIGYSKREDGDDSPVYAYWCKTIGDPVVDKAMIDAASPILRAKELEAPLLLIHGTDDGIVPVDQSRAMAKAMTAAGRPAKFVEIKWVGHRNWERPTVKSILTDTIAHIDAAFAKVTT